MPFDMLSIENVNRRHLLRQAACGFGSVALAGLAHADAASESAQSMSSGCHHRARAKRVIFLFMQGGPSQVDTFEYKPLLEKLDGQRRHFQDARKLAKTGQAGQERIMKSLWKFSHYGETGHAVSELFPHVAGQVDRICFLHGMHTSGVAHGPSTLFLHTGATNLVRPSMGSWIVYGLGSENRNVPGFITIGPSSANGGPRNYANAFLPARFQGTALGRAEQPVEQMRFRHIGRSGGMASSNALNRREDFELLQALNREQTARLGSSDEAEALIRSYELAWRMQMHAPQITDLSGESETTRRLYGIGDKPTDEYGKQCLMARRMAEAGVRFIQVNYSDNSSNPRWDQHNNIEKHADHARAVDKPIAGLIADLADRGLLEDTLVWWGGEFGRNPFAQNNDGRDHNPKGFTHFFVGGGTRPGYVYGATDEFGHEAVSGRVHMHDMHATILHILGINHEQLTYRHAGRDFRLTDVHGRVVEEILA